jgi:chaperone required for assembly of F1-ATPase
MAEWAPKRFWRSVSVVPRDTGHGIMLDTRPLLTPERRELLAPSQALARRIAAEWDAQGDVIAPASMPMTRMANTAIDRVAAKHAEVAAYLAQYGETDLLCYRAEGPKELVDRQAAAWDPLLDWTDRTFGARLVATEGVMPVHQSAEALAALAGVLRAQSAFEMTALHELVVLSGSLVLGLVAAYGHLPAEEVWTRSRIDENWQAEQWGRDDEAEAAAQNRRTGFLAAHAFLQAAQEVT